MEFDEYEYLERTVENATAARVSNGVGDRDGTYVSKRRNEEDGYRHEDRSKRIRADDGLEKRERSNKERGERDRRDRENRNDKERHRGDTGERENRAEKFRERGEKDRERDRSDIDSNRDRERRERDKERDRERDRSHSRSREVVDLHKDRERDNLREKEFRGRSKDKEYKEKDQDGERRHSREQRENKEEPQPDPEVDLERDQRTVFAYQICLKADERDVYEFFSKAGKVRDVRLIMDRNSRRSKGVGYIEFYDAMSVPMAITLSGQLLRGQPVMVKPSEAEKNLAHSAASAAEGAGGFIGPYSGGARRLYVGNLHFNITEDQLRQVFEPFGPVELVQLPTDPETGQCKGFGFVQYARLEDSRAAQQALNGVLELAGRVIKVSAVTDQVGSQDIGVVPGELDDDEGGGLSLTARSRALLMLKLDRSGIISSVTASAVVAPVTTPSLGFHATGVAGVSPTMVTPVLGPVGLPMAVVAMPNPGLAAVATAIEPVGVPTDCLMLRNMFDPSTETDPDFELDIKIEVQQECSKFGAVKHIFVDKYSQGHVYLRFDTLTSALNAQQALQGRWFAGKMVSTKFLGLKEYETKFPESK